MKNLSEYISESLKKVGEYRDRRLERDDFDIIQILERSFKEGELAGTNLGAKTAFKSWIESDIKECFNLSDSKLNKDFDKVVNPNGRHIIDNVVMQLNPISGFGFKGVARDRKAMAWGDYIWNSKTVDQLFEWFEGFGYTDKAGNWIDLRQFVTGWKITYHAYKGTECPKSNKAYLDLILTKEGQAIVDYHKRGREDMIGKYYADK